MQYRPQIDGLRAVAVLPVVLFHAGLAVPRGGFVGVDIFFVISGYLITRIILQELAHHEFSILRFYERRARRILPALFVVMLACIPFAWLYMLPEEFRAFSRSLIAVCLSGSNVLFWQEDGYFAAASERKPLLHTWSLAVEEQYYLLFPLLLLLLWRFGRRALLFSLLAATAASLLLSEWGWRHWPTANFYLPVTRAWELLAGSLCAFLEFTRGPRSSNLLSLAGLVLIVFALCSYDATTAMPSLYGLAPVAGAALIITFAGQRTWVARALSIRPLVGIGLISYSVYLWHQPLFALARLRHSSPAPAVMASLAMLSLVLAGLTWKYVEQPWRRPGAPSRGAVFLTSAAVAAALICVGLTGLAMQGNALRFDSAQLNRLESLTKQAGSLRGCLRNFTDLDASPCLLGARDSSVSIAFMGDSHAQQWLDAFHHIAIRNGWRVMVFAKSACPVADIRFEYAKLMRDYWECAQWREQVLQQLSSQPLQAIILTNSSLGYTRYNDGDLVSLSRWGAGISATLARLSQGQARLVWLMDNPQFRAQQGSSCVLRALLMQERSLLQCAEARAIAVDEQLQQLERAILGRFAGATVIDFTDFYCDTALCYPFKDDVPLMVDSNHLSTGAVALLSGRLEAELRGLTRLSGFTPGSDPGSGYR